MAHALDGAQLRVEWAERRLTDLRFRIADYARAEIDANDIDAEFKLGGQVVLTLSPMGPAPLDLAVLLGEVVYHLRSALDYLVFELAQLDSGKIQERTQFPIESTPEGFASRRTTYLRGVSPEHAESIRLLQPCAGCAWTRDLAAISNPDKHRALHATFSSQEGSVAVAIGTPAQISGQPGRLRPLRGDPARRSVKVHHSVAAVSVTFGDGEPGVIETLDHLKSQVALTIDTFRPAFG